MAGARLIIDVNDEVVLAALGRARARLGQARPMFAQIGSLLEASVRQRFSDGVAPDGTPWKPSRRAVRTGTKTLIDTSRLVRSITSQAEDDHVLVGTNVPYAAIHQFGGGIRQGARRQVLAFTPRGRGPSRFASRASTRRRQRGVNVTRIAIADYAARTVRMPARPFLGLSAADIEGIEAIVRRFVGEAIEGGDEEGRV